MLKNWIRGQFITFGILPALLIVMIVGFTLVEPRFASMDNLVNIARQLSFIGIITLGQMLYLVTGNYDLSNGGNVALSAIVCSIVLVNFPGDGVGGMAVAILVVLLLGGLIGLINATLIAVFRVHSFMATFGMGSITVGAGLLIAGGVPVVGLPEGFVANVGSGAIAGIPLSTIFFIIVAIVAFVFFNRTVVGRQAYAVGGNEQAAFQSGVPTRKVMFVVMISGSVLAGLVGVLLAARLGIGDANIGVQYPLESITAAVIGGVALAGGQGRVSGAIMGALFVVLLSTGMDLIRVQGYVQEILLGVMLIVALILDRVREKLRVKNATS